MDRSTPLRDRERRRGMTEEKRGEEGMAVSERLLFRGAFESLCGENMFANTPIEGGTQMISLYHHIHHIPFHSIVICEGRTSIDYFFLIRISLLDTHTCKDMTIINSLK